LRLIQLAEEDQTPGDFHVIRSQDLFSNRDFTFEQITRFTEPACLDREVHPRGEIVGGGERAILLRRNAVSRDWLRNAKQVIL
jgi:hypothetical protein